MGDGFSDARNHAVEVRAFWNRDAGDFHGDGGLSGGAQLTDRRNQRGIGGAPEAFRQFRLNQVAKFMAQPDEWSLRAVPRD